MYAGFKVQRDFSQKMLSVAFEWQQRKMLIQSHCVWGLRTRLITIIIQHSTFFLISVGRLATANQITVMNLAVFELLTNFIAISINYDGIDKFWSDFYVRFELEKNNEQLWVDKNAKKSQIIFLMDNHK